jgi:hypothetical protein
MARTARGILRQAESRTALFAYFAARMAGYVTHAFDDIFRTWGLPIRGDSALRAASRSKWHPPTKSRPGRKAAAGATQPEQAASFREWLLVDELRLDLEVALIQFPGRGSRQGDLLDGLRRTAGVRHIIETSRTRDVYAFAVFGGPQGRRELRARLEELATEMTWDDVLWETQEPAVETWRALARDAAEAEGLLDDRVQR